MNKSDITDKEMENESFNNGVEWAINNLSLSEKDSTNRVNESFNNGVEWAINNLSLSEKDSTNRVVKRISNSLMKRFRVLFSAEEYKDMSGEEFRKVPEVEKIFDILYFLEGWLKEQNKTNSNETNKDSK